MSRGGKHIDGLALAKHIDGGKHIYGLALAKHIDGLALDSLEIRTTYF